MEKKNSTKKTETKKVVAQDAKKTIKRRLQGVVVSNKMAKTVVVRVMRSTEHGKYRKIISSSKKYKAHTLENIDEGKTVTIEECRPISKDKAWKVIKVIEKK